LKKAEATLREYAGQLEEQKKALEGKNYALKEILAQIEAEKMEIKRQIKANSEKFLLPTLHKLKGRTKRGVDRRYLDLLESNLKNMVSEFGVKMGTVATVLSAREVEICNMIREGLPSKEIAELLQISLRTVDTHRNRIRKKLSINSRHVNLFTHLQAME
jgi:DNA-binding CsgD family transcriptional regulator